MTGQKTLEQVLDEDWEVLSIRLESTGEWSVRVGGRWRDPVTDHLTEYVGTGIALDITTAASFAVMKALESGVGR